MSIKICLFSLFFVIYYALIGIYEWRINMQKIGIIAAMQKELNLYLQEAKNYQTREINNHKFYLFNYSGCDVVLCISGMGKVCSAVTTAEMINHFNPDLIINMGVAGGIDSSLKIGDFVIADKVCYHDVWCGEPNLNGQMQGFPLYYNPPAKLLKLLSGHKQGLVCSGDQFITASEKLKQIKTDFPQALAVDMESCSIAQTCFIFAKPFLSVRQISDTPNSDNNVEQYEKFWQNAPQHSAQMLHTILDIVCRTEI